MNNQDTVSSRVGRKIRFFRKKRNLSQEELARAIHKSKSTLSKYESGSISIDVDSLYEIACALGVEIYQLVDEKVVDEAPQTLARPLFDGKNILYMYYYDGRFKSVVTTVLEIKYERAVGNNIPVYCYMDCPSVKNYESCKYYYSGSMVCHDLVSYVSLGNPNNSMEQLSFTILNPFHRGMETWGFMLAISYNPIVPLALKFLIMPEPLLKSDITREKLSFSKDELRLVKELNMMLLSTSWP
ncbi:MAG: helix-turn-helix transcriptional regulator [Coriobacteriaceae bacterium]|nr:helix-turn-helix transcriptional regulator [Coriobacteriaceae bacterium]